MEIFETEKEFNSRFPSRLFVCSRCGKITPDKYRCTNCNNQINNFVFRENNFEYTIKESEKSEQIFTPIEHLKNRNK